MRFIAAIMAATVIAGPAAAQELNKPGTEVKVGESVVVPYASGTDMTEAAPIEIAVTEIEKGTLDDLKGFDIPAELKDYLPYYVRYKWTNLSDQDLSHYSLSGIYIVDDRNQQQSWSRTTGERFEKCRSGGSIRDKTKGASAEGCNIFMIHKDGGLKAVLYKGTSPDKFPEVKAVYKDPIRWVPSDAAPAKTDDASTGKLVN